MTTSRRDSLTHSPPLSPPTSPSFSGGEDEEVAQPPLTTTDDDYETRRVPSLSLSAFEAMRHEDDVEEDDDFSFPPHNPATPIDDGSAGAHWENDVGASPKSGGKPPAVPISPVRTHSISAPQQLVTASRANYSAVSADGKKAPLVLLHITLLFLPGAEETILRKITPTMLERGLLVEHPRGDYQLLEELIIDSLGLDTAPDSDDDNDDDEWEKSLGVRRVNAKSAWEIRVYAANGLMTSGAWKRVWGEMERVDVEVGPRDWRGKEWGRIFADGGDKDPSQFVSRGVRTQHHHHQKKDVKFWMAIGAVVALLLAAVAGLYTQFAGGEVAPVTAVIPDKVEAILPGKEEAEIDILEATTAAADICAEETAAATEDDVDVDVEVSSAADTTETPACTSAATVEEAAPEAEEGVADKPEESEEQVLSTSSESAEQSAEGWWGWKA
jgi:hypothetical protein